MKHGQIALQLGSVLEIAFTRRCQGGLNLGAEQHIQKLAGEDRVLDQGADITSLPCLGQPAANGVEPF